MAQLFTAGEIDTPAIDYGDEGPEIYLNPSDTLELRSDGTVVFTSFVMKHDGDFVWWDMTQKVSLRFSGFVIFEGEHHRSSIFAPSEDGNAELRYVAETSPLGQALLARGLVSVQPT
jgi:hypothetical protein